MRLPDREIRRSLSVLALTVVMAVVDLVLAPGTIGGVAPSSAAPSSRRAPATHWVGAWSGSPSDGSLLRPALSDQTLRMVVAPHFGGETLRLHLSNRFGSSPITINRVDIGLRATGAAVVPGSDRIVRFEGRVMRTIPAGKDVVSDAVRLHFQPFQELAISVYVAGVITKPTEHLTTCQTNYLSKTGSGNHAGDQRGAAFTETAAVGAFSTGWYFLDAIDVEATRTVGAVVTFGDSITDGVQAQVNKSIERSACLNINGRYPDALARRLLSAHRPLSVLNAGIGGNSVLRSSPMFGPSGLSRLQQDVIAQAGVRDVIVLEGINDIAERATAAQVTAGLKSMISRLRRAGLHILLGTLTPAGGVPGGLGDSASNNERVMVNHWIRTQHLAEVVDFDKAVRDPRDPSRINPAYDDGDHLHFSVAGYRAMAQAVDLSELK